MLPLLTLLLVIGFIVVSTTRWRLHPFLALLVAAFAYGLANGVGPEATLAAVSAGVGRTVAAIGLVIAGGCIIGMVLERTGAALVLAAATLRLVGQARAVLALSLTGSIVSVPVFCDSGYVVLSPLARSLARRTREPLAVFATALSMGLYATHCLVPPTPGPVAAAGELRADVGRVIGLGLVVGVPVVLVTWWYAVRAGRRWGGPPPAADGSPDPAEPERPRTSVSRALLPILVPVLLIAMRSFVGPRGGAWLQWLGDPNVALLLGALLALGLFREVGAATLGEWSAEALRTAGSIVLITAAGGALGAVLRVTPLATLVGEWLTAASFGRFNLVLPFLVAAGLKTAQGSSTVAMITAASLVAPLLAVLGLQGPTDLALTTLAIGAGAMTVSHVNDSYFWVVTQLSGLTVAQGYRLITVASGLAGVTALVTLLLLRLVLP